jgi:ubiquinone/menaquinone biosynthesis C-methylase UbiE
LIENHHVGKTASDKDYWSSDECAEKYDDSSNRQFYRSIMARLLESSPPLSGVGLDLGCGSGFSTEVLVDAFPLVRWFGADASLSMLEKGREKPNLFGVPLVVADAIRLPFADASFDVVVANFSWHWFGEGAGAEVCRVLKPNGLFLASIPLRQWAHSEGNRMLARMLFANRRGYQPRQSQGYGFEQTETLLPGKFQTISRVAMVITETFRDGRGMIAHLHSRGALWAIFGEPIWPDFPLDSPVDYEWPFAVVHLRRLL